jgi:hypothetical protein
MTSSIEELAKKSIANASKTLKTIIKSNKWSIKPLSVDCGKSPTFRQYLYRLLKKLSFSCKYICIVLVYHVLVRLVLISDVLSSLVVKVIYEVLFATIDAIKVLCALIGFEIFEIYCVKTLAMDLIDIYKKISLYRIKTRDSINILLAKCTIDKIKFAKATN